jgi:xylulokinase
MAERYVIGVDVGTQGTKAALFRSDGRLMGEGFRESHLHRPSVGVVEEDPEEQVTAACTAISQAVEAGQVDPANVEAIAVDGQMAGIMAVGEDGRNVTPYDSWLDTRCAPYIDRMQQEAGDEIVAKAGMAPSFNHGPKVLWWKHERPEVYERIAAFVQPASYVAMRFCELPGREGFIDRSYLHFSGFADNRNNRWDEGLCRRFDVDPEKLPQIKDSHEVIGEFSEAMAQRCGLTAGVKVLAGCGDTAASFLASGATAPGLCVDVAGTASVFAATTEEFRPDAEHRTLGVSQSAIPGLWNVFAYINGGGMNLEWFRRDLLSQVPGLNEHEVDFAELNRLAEESEEKLFFPLFIPHLAGRVTPADPHLRGAWVGLEWGHGLGLLYRAMLEAVAFEYGIYRDILGELYPDFHASELRITGGGEKSALWNRIKATVLNMTVQQITGSKGAPMGSAMLAGYGAGLFDDVDAAARKWLEFGSRQEPDTSLTEHYRQKQQLYTRLMQQLSAFSQEASTYSEQ